MSQLLTASWWVVVLRGVLLVLLGIFAFSSPGVTAAVLILWLASFIIADAILAFIAAATGRTGGEDRWLVVLEGMLGLCLGFLLLRAPGAALIAASMLLGGWMVFSGVLKLALAIQLRKEIEGEFWLGLIGVLGIFFGFLIFSQPGLGIATLLGIVAIFAFLSGVFQIILGFRLRGLRDTVASVVEGVRNRARGV
jgi:uncharacterized membrane protein HdeD (DUF308 family)